MKKKTRIPIFVKLSFLSTLLICLAVGLISFTILKKQKKQFIDQLVNLGSTMVNIAANNAPDKILGEDELALFQLLTDIKANEQVILVLITNQDNLILAHSNLEEANKVYSPPRNLSFIREANGIKVSSFALGEEEFLFFEKSLTFQKIKVGDVRLAVSQKRIIQNIKAAERFILILTIFIMVVGILLSLKISTYFSKPIKELRDSTIALGDGKFSHRVVIDRNDELGDLGLAFNRMAVGLEERETLRETFGKYVTPEIRDEILADNIPLNGERRMATIVFSDLRNFTPFVEQNTPEVVIKSMRIYFTAMQKAVRKYKGIMLQYVGDEFEAVFGVPVRNKDHAENAVLAALEMKKLLAQLNEAFVKKGMSPFKHGVGIHTGEVLAGNTGSNDHLCYTLFGNTVNLASRIQGLTKEYEGDILASEETIKRVKRKFSLKKEGPLLVKGYSKPIVVYQVF